MCLNFRSIINKKTELNIMVDDIKPHIIGITANNVITDAELGLEGYVMFRKDRMGRRGGGVLLYIKETIPAYEVQLQEEADCKEALWCNLVTGHTTVTIGVVYRCPNITIQNNEKIHVCMYVYIYSPDMDIQKYTVTMKIIVNSVKISSPIGTISNSEVVDLQ